MSAQKRALATKIEASNGKSFIESSCLLSNKESIILIY
jgi:hypothetical protein